ncbi:MAG TPA: hypothetical protein VI454_09840 [Verrucomicrobiae bacterium]
MNPLLAVWYFLEYAAARALVFVLGITPLPLLLGFAELLARVAFVVLRGRRSIAIDNLLQGRVCDSPEAARRMAFQAFRAFTLMIIETAAARRRMRADNWKDFVTLHVEPEAEKLLNQPETGVLVASAHIGNWEIAAHAASTFKPICVVYRPFNNPYLDRYLHQARSGERLHLISRLDLNPMRFLQSLSAGEALALMIDQHVYNGAVQVEYFGRPAWTTKSVAMLHLTTRAPLLIAYALRTGPLRYEVHAIGPIRCTRTGDREKDAFEITQALTREIEKIARRHPEQYMWGHRRWK